MKIWYVGWVPQEVDAENGWWSNESFCFVLFFNFCNRKREEEAGVGKESLRLQRCSDKVHGNQWETPEKTVFEEPHNGQRCPGPAAPAMLSHRPGPLRSIVVSDKTAKQILRVLTAGGCQRTALLTAGQHVISLRGS